MQIDTKQLQMDRKPAKTAEVKQVRFQSYF